MLGSDIPEPCRNGTYAPTTGLISDAECLLCDGGFYCNGTGLSAVSGECDQGKNKASKKKYLGNLKIH